jgi:hypothetical protein
MRFDFQNIYRSIGLMIVGELKNLMTMQQGVDNQRYSGLADSTLKSKARRNDISSDVKAKRMLTTRDFQNNAYKMQPFTDGLRVYINEGKHGRELKSLTKTLKKYRATGQTGKAKVQAQKVVKKIKSSPSYRQITEWQIDTGNSTFFPQTDAHVSNLQSFQRGKIQFQKEAERQMAAQIKLSLRSVCSLG